MEVLRLVVASPGDVQQERDAVERVVTELNRGVCADRGITLQITRWETDAYPGFHVDGPQGLLDSLLRIEDCDCLVGIFWKRFGTPVKEASSGTEHEIQSAVRAWRRAGKPQIMIYFSSRPYTPASKSETDQWGQVLEFRKSFPSEGLWWTYSDPADFERLLRQHLTEWLRHVRPVPPVLQPATQGLNDRIQYVDRYRALIDSAHDEILIFASKFHRSEVLTEASEINRSLRAARQRNVKVSILHSTGFDRLPAALELANGGIEVRFDPDLPASDINFATFDNHTVLIGLRQASQDASTYRRSIAWTEFTSVQLSATLRREFQRRWIAFRTRSIGLLLRELVPSAVNELGIDGVSRQLHLPAETIQRLSKQPSTTVLLIGRPGSGKSTVARSFISALNTAAVPLRVHHLADLEFIRRAFQQDDRKRSLKTDDGGWFVTDETLYDDALRKLAADVRALQSTTDIIVAEFARKSYLQSMKILEEEGVRPDLIVYLDVPLITALERNKTRARSGGGHYVSEREMRETYTSDDAHLLVNGWRVFVIRNDELNRAVAEQASEQLFERIRAVTSQTAIPPT